MTRSVQFKFNYLIAKYLRSERRKSRRTQLQAAWKIGVTLHQFLEIESGRRSISLNALAKLAEFYEVNFKEMSKVIHQAPSQSQKFWNAEELMEIAFHRVQVQFEDSIENREPMGRTEIRTHFSSDS